MLSIVGTNKKRGVALRDLRVDQCFTIDDRHFRKTGKDTMENGDKSVIVLKTTS